MKVNINVPAHTIHRPTTYFVDIGQQESFPFLTIDRDSYIVDAQIQTGIDLSQDGVHNIQIGKHTAIADQILFLVDLNHDYLSVFQGCISYIESSGKIRNADEFKIGRRGQIIIQNDCWIGHGATIMGGVTIHNGAVVAANATVTRDVPPYAIVGGNPAKVLKYRFSTDIITKLQQIAWWEWPEEKLMENKKWLLGDVSEFVTHFSNDEIAKIMKGMERDGKKRFLFYLDMNEPFALYSKIINQFAKNYHGKDAELLLIGNQEEQDWPSNFEMLMHELEVYENYDICISIYDANMYNDTEMISSADYYITNRMWNNIVRMCIAERYGVCILSGVDSHVFANAAI